LLSDVSTGLDDISIFAISGQRYAVPFLVFWNYGRLNAFLVVPANSQIRIVAKLNCFILNFSLEINRIKRQIHIWNGSFFMKSWRVRGSFCILSFWTIFRNIHTNFHILRNHPHLHCLVLRHFKGFQFVNLLPIVLIYQNGKLNLLVIIGFWWFIL
jgi:hypothetical protein